MAEAEKKTPPKNPDDLPKEFRALVRIAPKPGDRRTTTKRFSKGDMVSFDGYASPFIFETATLMEVIEEYKNGLWQLVSYKTSTARPAPTFWKRLRKWLFGSPRIPPARIVNRKDV